MYCIYWVYLLVYVSVAIYSYIHIFFDDIVHCVIHYNEKFCQLHNMYWCWVKKACFRGFFEVKMSGKPYFTVGYEHVRMLGGAMVIIVILYLWYLLLPELSEGGELNEDRYTCKG